MCLWMLKGRWRCLVSWAGPGRPPTLARLLTTNRLTWLHRKWCEFRWVTWRIPPRTTRRFLVLGWLCSVQPCSTTSWDYTTSSSTVLMLMRRLSFSISGNLILSTPKYLLHLSAIYASFSLRRGWLMCSCGIGSVSTRGRSWTRMTLWLKKRQWK